MNWNIVSRRLFRIAGLLAFAVALSGMLRSGGLYAFTRTEIEGLNTLILLVGSIYSVIFAFTIFVIWGQFNDVENFVMREANALRDLLRFSHYLNTDAEHALRRAVTNYVHLALQSEWDALSERRRDKDTENAFTKLAATVIQTPAKPDEEDIHERLIDIVRKAADYRDDRITKSLMRIPGTLLWLVNILAATLLLLMFVYPFQHWISGAACFVLLALVLFFADLVMTDTDNPFHGVCNVTAQPLADLLQ